MKVSKGYLKKIIAEELEKVVSEDSKAGKIDRKDVANIASGRWLKEEEEEQGETLEEEEELEERRRTADGSGETSHGRGRYQEDALEERLSTLEEKIDQLLNKG
jgi:hypothetical protein